MVNSNYLYNVNRCKYYVERKRDTPSMRNPAARESELVDFCRDCIT